MQVVERVFVHPAESVRSASQVKDTCPHVYDFIWRIVLALGFIPASSCLYLRAHMKETARFTAHVTKDVQAGCR